jgi:Ca2+/Na+ antiporter
MMHQLTYSDMIPAIIFLVLLTAGSGFFFMNMRKIARNIKLGRNLDRNDRPRNDGW